MTNKIELTKEGQAKLNEEYRHLVDVERPEVIKALSEARAQGDLSENADYDAARSRQGEIEDRIKEIEGILANAIIISEKPKSNKVVSLGTIVTLKDLSDDTEATYTIVGSVESNPMKGLVSNASPLGLALLNHHVGDVVEIKVAKPYSVEVLKIEVQQ